MPAPLGPDTLNLTTLSVLLTSKRSIAAAPALIVESYIQRNKAIVMLTRLFRLFHGAQQKVDVPKDDVTLDAFSVLHGQPLPSAAIPWNKAGLSRGIVDPSEVAFDEAAYLAANSDVAASVAQGLIASGWVHYQKHGRHEGRPLSPAPPPLQGPEAESASAQTVFDEAWYTMRYPGTGGFKPFNHYILHGRFEGRYPNAYAEAAKQKIMNVTPPPSFEFHEESYLRRYPDVARAVQDGTIGSGLEHFLQHGMRGRRCPNAIMPEQTAIMNRFCALGEDCEFGITQRFYGAEPIDLLRWAATPHAVLSDLLENGFSGIADSEHLTAKIVDNQPTGEWSIRNARYGFVWHTWAYANNTTREAIIKREERRIARLADKLLEDLSDASRCFVRWGRSHDIVQSEQVFSLIRRYNPRNRLLSVVRSSPEHEPGTVVAKADGWFVGYIDRFSNPDARASTTNASIWHQICRQIA